MLNIAPPASQLFLWSDFGHLWTSLDLATEQTSGKPKFQAVLRRINGQILPQIGEPLQLFLIEPGFLGKHAMKSQIFAHPTWDSGGHIVPQQTFEQQAKLAHS